MVILEAVNMIFINQLDYPELEFVHNTKAETAPPELTNVARSGCGMCCLCMIVGNLTVHELPIAECLRISLEEDAHPGYGTRMAILGPVIAERYGLTFEHTRSLEVLKAHLQKGGMAIANVAGNVNGRKGLFSPDGHYIVVTAWDGERMCVLDPYLYDGKFEEEGRKGKVAVDTPFLYCTGEDLLEDSKQFFLFARKKP